MDVCRRRCGWIAMPNKIYNKRASLWLGSTLRHSSFRRCLTVPILSYNSLYHMSAYTLYTYNMYVWHAYVYTHRSDGIITRQRGYWRHSLCICYIHIYISAVADLLAMRSRPIKREIYARILFWNYIDRIAPRLLSAHDFAFFTLLLSLNIDKRTRENTLSANLWENDLSTFSIYSAA